MSEDSPLSPSLREVVDAAFERAFGWLETDESFLAFAVLDAPDVVGMPIPAGPDGQRRLVCPLVLAQDEAPLQEYVTEHRDEIAAYAIVADVIVTDTATDERSAAVTVEAGERGGANGFVLCTTYVKETSETPPTQRADHGVVAVVPNRLRPA